MNMVRRRAVGIVLVIIASVVPLVAGSSLAAGGVRSRGKPVVLRAAEVQSVLDRFVAETGAPGGVVALQVRGGPILTAVSGSTGVATGVPIRADDRFYVGSLTKTFVGALALKLTEQGRLSLDAPINRYLGDWPHGDRITVRELLNHSSGFGPFTFGGSDKYSKAYGDLLEHDLTHTFTPDEVLALVRDHPLDSKPGTKVTYSNINTLLLGKIIAKVTGGRLGSALRSQLLAPLGLDATTYAAEETPEPAPDDGVFTLVDNGPLVDTASFPKTAVLTSIGAAGAMSSSAPDLVKWAAALYRDHMALAPATSARAFRIGPGGTGLGVLGFGGANGFCVFAEQGCPKGEKFPAIGGSGSIPGTSSRLIYDRRTDAIIALVVSRDEVGADAPLDALRKIVARAERGDASAPG